MCRKFHSRTFVSDSESGLYRTVAGLEPSRSEVIILFYMNTRSFEWVRLHKTIPSILSDSVGGKCSKLQQLTEVIPTIFVEDSFFPNVEGSNVKFGT